jgi:DNA-binding NarL/FixJ family response regulator
MSPREAACSALHCALGDEDSAVTELTTARRRLSELGAAPAEREVAVLLAPIYPSGLTERGVEVLRLVASGRTNPEIAKLLFIREKTVSRRLSNIFTKLDVSWRTAASACGYEEYLT